MLPEVANAAWCPVCFAPLTDEAAEQLRPPPAPHPLAPAPSDAHLPASSISSVGPWSDRWQATDVTFGAVGRLVVTALWTAPFAFFLFAGVPFGLVGAVAYAPVWYRGVRDLWRRADRITAASSHRRGRSHRQGTQTWEDPGHPRG